MELFDVLDQARRTSSKPLPEPLVSALGLHLLDFLTREHAQTPPRLHRDAFAKLGCMSPEQARGRPLDVRSDLFSAGVLLFELSCGRRPFATVADLVDGHLEPPAATSPSLAAVLTRALAHDPAKRFASAAELRGALADAVTAAEPATFDAWLKQLAPPAPVQQPAASTPPAAPAPRRGVLRTVGAGALLLLPIAATLGILRYQEQRQLDAQREYTASLRTCEVLTEPSGASVTIDGVAWKNRTPTIVSLEPGRDYVLELRSNAGAVIRHIKNQRKLEVQLPGGVVLANDVWGEAPATSGKPAAQTPLAPDPRPQHVAAYDLESAPATFKLWPEHQLLIPK
jgi:hypothetical protein